MINKAVAGQSELKDVHAYVDSCKVRACGTGSDVRMDFTEWEEDEIAIVKQFISLVASKAGYEEGVYDDVFDEVDTIVADKIVANLAEKEVEPKPV